MYICSFCSRTSHQREWICGGCGKPAAVPEHPETLRIQIAISAMNALLHGSRLYEHEPRAVLVAQAAFSVADAMIAQSKVENPKEPV